MIKRKKRKSINVPSSRDDAASGLLVVIILITAAILIVDIQVLVRVAPTKHIVVNIALRPEIRVVLFDRLDGRRGLVGGHDEPLGDIPLRLFDVVAHDGLVALGLLAQHDAGVDVGGRRDLGIIEEGQDGDEDGLDALRGRPALRGELAGHLVFAGGVQDRDAEFAVLVDVGVVEGAQEAELYRGIGVLASAVPRVLEPWFGEP